MPLVSLCSTNYQTHPVTLRSLESIVARIRDIDAEMVVVDNFSDDGSFESLASFRSEFPLRLVRRRCSRGLGRQLAFELSQGEYVVTFDLDTVYNDNWARLLRWVLRNKTTYGLSSVYSQFYPRSALDAVGGWRDFQYWEDVDLWVRLASRGLYRTYPIVTGVNLKRTAARNRVERIARLFARCRDKVAISDWIPFRLYAAGYLGKFRGSSLSYQLSVFGIGYAAGRMKRLLLCRDGYDTSTVRHSSIAIDCNLVTPEAVRPAVSLYDTENGCARALARGDFGFLPGTYD